MKSMYAFALLMCISLAYAILVTKDMRIDNPQVESLEEIGLAGKEWVEKYGPVDASTLPPVILIPGVGGSRLNARVTNVNHHIYCAANANWYRIWLSLEELLPGWPEECWAENIALIYNTATGGYSNASNVDIETDPIGQTTAMEFLDPNFPKTTVYYAQVAQALVNIGYVRGQNLIGAPYDWRLATPANIPQWYVDLQTTIENTAAAQGPVVVVAHSMGNLMFSTFLRGMTQEWKNKFIRDYVAISCPWIGAVDAILSLSTGYNFGIPYLFNSESRIIQRTLASAYWLLPAEGAWNTTLVQTPQRGYGSTDYEAMFSDMDMPTGYAQWSESAHIVDNTKPLGVNVYCHFGGGVPTTKFINFTIENFNSTPSTVTGNGDGTVNIESLEYCQNFVGNNAGFNVNVTGYPGQSHVGVLAFKPLLNNILAVVTSTATFL